MVRRHSHEQLGNVRNIVFNSKTIVFLDVPAEKKLRSIFSRNPNNHNIPAHADNQDSCNRVGAGACQLGEHASLASNMPVGVVLTCFQYRNFQKSLSSDILFNTINNNSHIQ